MIPIRKILKTPFSNNGVSFSSIVGEMFSILGCDSRTEDRVYVTNNQRLFFHTSLDRKISNVAIHIHVNLMDNINILPKVYDDILPKLYSIVKNSGIPLGEFLLISVTYRNKNNSVVMYPITYILFDKNISTTDIQLLRINNQLYNFIPKLISDHMLKIDYNIKNFKFIEVSDSGKIILRNDLNISLNFENLHIYNSIRENRVNSMKLSILHSIGYKLMQDYYTKHNRISEIGYGNTNNLYNICRGKIPLVFVFNHLDYQNIEYSTTLSIDEYTPYFIGVRRNIDLEVGKHCINIKCVHNINDIPQNMLPGILYMIIEILTNITDDMLYQIYNDVKKLIEENLI